MPQKCDFSKIVYIENLLKKIWIKFLKHIITGEKTPIPTKIKNDSVNQQKEKK
jgi:hypothetical protein